MAQAKKSVHCDSSLRVKPQVMQLKTLENVRKHSCGVFTSDETVSIQNSSKQGMILDGGAPKILSRNWKLRNDPEDPFTPQFAAVWK